MISLVFVTNGIWYAAKFLANDNGLKVSWFYNHFLEFTNMWELSHTGKTQSIRVKATIYLILLILLPILLFSIITICA